MSKTKLPQILTAPGARESQGKWIKGRIPRERKFETWWLQKWMKMMGQMF
jgi:hypothetical protein